MSRQLAEQGSLLQHQETLIPEPEKVGDQFLQSNPNKKRTDWNEYIDPEEEVEFGDDCGDIFEPEILTELPKALFKKPKLRSFHLGEPKAKEGQDLFQPVFRKTGVNKKMNQLVEELRMSEGTDWRENSKWKEKKQAVEYNCGEEPIWHISRTAVQVSASSWRENDAQDSGDGANDKYAYRIPSRQAKTKPRGDLKWSEFIAEEDDGFLQESSRGLGDKPGSWNSLAVFETRLNDQLVQDDIHPDFL